MDFEKPTVKLIGQDGNAFFILGTVNKALKKAGYPEKAKEFMAEVKGGDYDNLLATAMKYAEIE